MHLNYLFIPLLFLIFISCQEKKDTDFEIQAHRGGRGLMPENTILSEKLAVDYGSTLELDLQMSKDKKIIVAHDAFFNALYCLTPEGDTMTKKEGKQRLIYDMPYDSVVQYDCGSKPYAAFPEQKNIPAFRPTLAELIDSVEAYAKTKGHTNFYNIELKSRPEWDGKHYPSLEEYVDSSLLLILRSGIADRTSIQSFDVRALQRVHEKWPEFPIFYLTGKQDKDLNEFIDLLGFKPDILSPGYKNVTPELINACHAEGIKVIVGVPNTLEEIQHLKDMGADGVITDYPNLGKSL